MSQALFMKPHTLEIPGAATLARDETRGRHDPVIVFLATMLMAFGVAMVYSASVTLRGPAPDLHAWWNTPLKQAAFTLAGFMTMLIAAHFDYRALAWRRPRDGWRAGTPAAISLLLLIAVLIPGIGERGMGAQRNLPILHSPLSIGFQPSELAKVIIVVWIAALLTRPGFDPRNARAGLLPALLSGGLLIGLTGVEDFGTAALMGAVLLALLLLAGARWTHLLATMLAGGLAGGALLLLKDYRLERLTTFFSKAPDAAGSGYQINQALIAIGSGGWFGRGLGAGIQKYGYLPQDNNDFIFAIICEELGVIGGLAVISMYLVLLLRGAWIAARAGDPYGRLLAAGLTLLITVQAAFNLGVVTNSIPTKGISLPFISEGGSGVLFLGLAAGLVASVGRSVQPREQRKAAAAASKR